MDDQVSKACVPFRVEAGVFADRITLECVPATQILHTKPNRKLQLLASAAFDSAVAGICREFQRRVFPMVLLDIAAGFPHSESR